MTVASPSRVFAERIGRIEVSATMAVAAEAAKLRAQGINLVDFGAGEPHFKRRTSTFAAPLQRRICRSSLGYHARRT